MAETFKVPSIDEARARKYYVENDLANYNAPVANDIRRADLDKQIAEIESKLGAMGDRTLESEMGWWDYAVHGDRSGLEAYASRKQNADLQKRQFAENLVEQQNRAMRSLQEAQADVDDLKARQARGEVISAKDMARANAALNYALSEAGRVGVKGEYTQPYSGTASATTSVKNEIPVKEGTKNEGTVGGAEVIENAEAWLENPDENGQAQLDALAKLSDDAFRNSKKSLSARISKAMEEVVGKKNSANVIANAQRVIGTKGVKKEDVAEQRKLVAELPDSPEKQKALMEIDNKYKALNTPKDNTLKDWVTKNVTKGKVAIESSRGLGDLNTKGEAKFTQTINGKNYTYYLVKNGNEGIDVTDDKKRVLKSFSNKDLDYEAPAAPAAEQAKPSNGVESEKKKKTDWTKVPGAIGGDW